MNSLAELKSFIRAHSSILILATAIFFVLLTSLSVLTTRPKLWTDEALTLEIAKSFSKTGTLNVEVSPNIFFEQPYLLQSTGYPLTILLGLVFKIFGYSLVTERVVMLLIMIGALFAVYFFGRKMFNDNLASLAVLLIVTFSSFYGSGRAGVGEILGFIFLIGSLYYLLSIENYYLSGLFLGLAVAVKPSVFLLALPAIIFAIYTQREGFIKNISKFLAVSALPIIAWTVLVMGNPFSVHVWSTILNFYRNPYHATSISSNFMGNLFNFFQSTTLIYFGALFVIICASRYYLEDKKLKTLYNFIIAYSIIAFIYYLRSPGWLRYILIAELLILFALPSAIQSISKKYNLESFTSGAITLFLVIQVIQFFTGAQIYAGDAAIQTADYINRNYIGQSVGVINSLEVSSLIDTNNKYQSFILLGLPIIGSDFLAEGVTPDILVYGSDTKFSVDAERAIKDYYIYLKSMDGQEIYTLKK